MKETETAFAKELHRLVDQLVWSNRAWIEYVYSRPAVEDRPRQILAHILYAEQLWFERVAGAPQPRNTFVVVEKADVLRALEENERTYRSLIDGRLEDVIDFKRVSGEEYHARVADIVHHLVTHGYHHRGQLATHYARQGVEYPNTDHINWLIVERL